MIIYNNNMEALYDFNMIVELTGANPSFLNRAIKKYGFKSNEYVKYQNRHLYKQSAVIDFIVFLVNTGTERQQKNELI